MTLTLADGDAANTAPPLYELKDRDEQAFRAAFDAATRALLANRPLGAESTPALATPNALSAPELAALADTEPTAGPPPAPPHGADPLGLAVTDFMALVDTSLGTREVAGLLGKDRSRVLQRLRTRTLFGFTVGNEWRVPAFQFERGREVPGLAEVVAALPTDLHPLDVVEWFVTDLPDLEMRDGSACVSPREWLLRGLPPASAARLAAQL